MYTLNDTRFTNTAHFGQVSQNQTSFELKGNDKDLVQAL